MLFFKNIEYLWLLILIIPLVFFIKHKVNSFDNIFAKEVLDKIKLSKRGFSKQVKAIFLIISFIFMVISFARPVINNGEIKVKSSFVDMVVAIDMSKSMFATDIYPNRFEFAKMKFLNMLKFLKNTKVALIGFSSQTFLISPLTQDFHTLKYLASNLNLENISLKGTDILTTLSTANDMFGQSDKKILFLLTDGGDANNFKKELEYAKSNNITVYIYNIGTKKGGIIKDANGALKDKNGNLVVVKLNENIKKLALGSGGAYLEASLKKDDIKQLTTLLEHKFKAKDDEVTTIKNERELFYFPLILAILFFSMAIFSTPKRRMK